VGEFLRLAFRWRVVRRALGFAVVVGAILVAINYGDALPGEDELARRDLLKMALTVCVPYAVSMLSSVTAMRDRNAAGGRGPGGP
jgi:hypothetical protein